jgi:hypothetical protein
MHVVNAMRGSYEEAIPVLSGRRGYSADSSSSVLKLADFYL